jgi:hypothetical protein
MPGRRRLATAGMRPGSPTMGALATYCALPVGGTEIAEAVDEHSVRCRMCMSLLERPQGNPDDFRRADHPRS